MFHFRLQRVLEIREKREQEAASRLAEARDEAEVARVAQEALEAAREEGLRRLGTGGASTVGQLHNLSFVVEHLNRQIQDAHGAVLAADDNVRKLLAEFTVAFQDRHVLGKLRERQQGEWMVGEVAADRQRMDAIALTRFIRKGATSGAES